MHDQRELGVPKKNGVATSFLHAFDDPLQIFDRRRLEYAANQFIHDDPIDLVTFDHVRAHALDSTRCELVRVEIALGQPPCAGKADTAKSTRDRMGGDHLGRYAARAAAIALQCKAALHG